MKNAAGFCLRDQELSAEPFHYKMCGLDDIYLLNGYEIEVTKYDVGVTIKNADDLHHAIGLYLIKNRKVLGPKDVRFLRKNMRMTQDELALELGVTSQSVARYEKGTTEIPGPADRLLRFYYIQHLTPEAERVELVDQVCAGFKSQQILDECRDDPVYFGNSDQGWKKQRRTILHEICASAYA